MVKNLLASLIAATLGTAALPSRAADVPSPDADGFTPIFDGKSLTGWDGDPTFWRVEDGALVGESTPDKPVKQNTFLIWNDGEVDDFELKVKWRIPTKDGNSGIQVRSFRIPDEKNPWRVGGYQADFEAGKTWPGLIYGEQFRGILAKRGTKAEIGDDHKPTVTGEIGDPDELIKAVNFGDWNETHIVAQGHTIRHSINGTLMSELVDNDKEMRRRAGIVALQMHTGPPMRVEFSDIRLKRTKLQDLKKVVFLAGTPSHGPGQHEHYAGSMLLSRILSEQVGDRILPTVYQNGWPHDPTALTNADAVIMFCTGGGAHFAKFHLRQLDQLNEQGMGLGAIHYAVEIPKGDQGGDHFLKWMGGFFEANWSVNPHWDADFTKFPEHPVAKGLEPFKIHDEWYFHMRFREGMDGVTPILTSIAPDSTMSRGDGAHSGNPAAREAVKNKDPQHVMWVAENKNGSRGFGFTGAHFHKNWAEPNFRKAVLNAVTWIAGADVPENGVPTAEVSEDDLKANLDKK